MSFQLSSKSSLSESASLMAEMANSAAMAAGNMMASGHNSSQAVSEQLMNKDTLVIHKLELENQRLRWVSLASICRYVLFGVRVAVP